MDKEPAPISGTANRRGLSRKHIMDSVKESLARLQVSAPLSASLFSAAKLTLLRSQMDYIDVLQCHRFDQDTPVEETMDALHDVSCRARGSAHGGDRC